LKRERERERVRERAALLAHAEGVLYGMELGSVTLKINNQTKPKRESFIRNYGPYRGV